MLRARPSSGSKARAKRAVPSRRSLPQPLKGPSPRASTADRLPSGSTTCFLAGPKPEPARSLLLFVRPFHPPRARSSCTFAPPRARICFREGYRDRRLGLLVEIPCWPVPALALQNEEGAKEFEMRREESPERGETVASSIQRAGTRACTDPNPSRIGRGGDRGARGWSLTHICETGGPGRRVGAGGRRREGCGRGKIESGPKRQRVRHISGPPSHQIKSRIELKLIESVFRILDHERPVPPPPNTHRPPAASQT